MPTVDFILDPSSDVVVTHVQVEEGVDGDAQEGRVEAAVHPGTRAAHVTHRMVTEAGRQVKQGAVAVWSRGPPSRTTRWRGERNGASVVRGITKTYRWTSLQIFNILNKCYVYVLTQYIIVKMALITNKS